MQARVYRFAKRVSVRACAGCGRHPAKDPDKLCPHCRAIPSFARWFDQVARARS